MGETKYFSKLKEEKILMTTCSDPTTAFHDHDFLELTYVLQGQAAHQMEEQRSVIGQGDYFIVDYGVRHKYEQIGSTPFTVVNCLFLPRLIDETLSHCHRFEDLADNYLIKFDYRNLSDRPTGRIYHDEDGRIGKLINRLSKEYNEKPPGYREMMRCQLIEILIETMRQVHRPEKAPSGSDLVQFITDKVHKNFMDKLSLAEISKTCCYSLAYVRKRFKEEKGMTFQAYLQAVRVQEACRLLANTGKKVGEISALVGYTDIKFFNRVFKAQMGMTPREFKKIYSKER